MISVHFLNWISCKFHWGKRTPKVYMWMLKRLKLVCSETTITSTFKYLQIKTHKFFSFPSIYLCQFNLWTLFWVDGVPIVNHRRWNLNVIFPRVLLVCKGPKTWLTWFTFSLAGMWPDIFWLANTPQSDWTEPPEPPPPPNIVWQQMKTRALLLVRKHSIPRARHISYGSTWGKRWFRMGDC